MMASGESWQGGQSGSRHYTQQGKSEQEGMEGVICEGASSRAVDPRHFLEVKIRQVLEKQAEEKRRDAIDKFQKEVSESGLVVKDSSAWQHRVPGNWKPTARRIAPENDDLNNILNRTFHKRQHSPIRVEDEPKRRQFGKRLGAQSTTSAAAANDIQMIAIDDSGTKDISAYSHKETTALADNEFGDLLRCDEKIVRQARHYANLKGFQENCVVILMKLPSYVHTPRDLFNIVWNGQELELALGANIPFKGGGVAFVTFGDPGTAMKFACQNRKHKVGDCVIEAYLPASPAKATSN